jgi:general secretion pathway protein G
MENRIRRNAFTLIELLLVLVILAILAAVVVPKFTNRSEQARDAAAKTDIANMETALDTFEIDNGRYPATEEGLGALSSQPANCPNWKGPYMKKQVANDPWGTPYVYKYPGTHTQNGYDLYSLGPDKRESEDDIGNWTK